MDPFFSSHPASPKLRVPKAVSLLSRDLARHNNGNQTPNQTCPPCAPHHHPCLPACRLLKAQWGLSGLGGRGHALSLPCPPSPVLRAHPSYTGLGLSKIQRCAPGRPAPPQDWKAAAGDVAGARAPALTQTSPPPSRAPRPSGLAALPSASLTRPDLKGSVRAPSSVTSRVPDPGNPLRTAPVSLCSLFLRPTGRGPRYDLADGVFDPFFVCNLLERGSGPQHYQPAPHK